MIGISKYFMKNISSQAGFSLIELLVSLSIITILTAIFLANYHNINQRTDLTMTAQTMVSDIRYAQANALGLIKYEGAIPKGGWGVFLSAYPNEKGQYTIFADIDGNQEKSGDEASLAYGTKTVVLPPNISIDGIFLPNGSQVLKTNIIFMPPDPLTYIVTEAGTSTAVSIRLKESVNNTTILINNFFMTFSLFVMSVY